jgi:hypothetical protein
MKQEKILTWFENQKKKDLIEINSEKQKFIKDLKKITKSEMFQKDEKPKKLSLWKKIKIIIWGK